MRIVLSTERSTNSTKGPGWNVRLGLAGHDPGPARFVAAQVDDGRWWPQLPGAADYAELFRHQSAQVLTMAPATDAERERLTDGALTYGKYLFETFVDAGEWAGLTAEPSGPIELAIRCDPDDTDLHRLVWELLFDPARGSHLARDPRRPMSIVRQVRPAPGVSDRSVPEITKLPRFLHFAATGITDPTVRPGAETVGVLQGMQRTGGVVDTRAAYDRSLADLRIACQRFHPHVVHLVAAARWDVEGRRAVLQMRLDGAPGWAEVTATQLADALTYYRRLPSIVLLSACEAGAMDTGMPLEQAAAALAAELVAAGIPIVVALTGVVSDIAYRLFVRVLGASIAKGLPVAEATAGARVVAFGRQRAPHPIGWALSPLFASTHLPEGHRPVTFNSRRRVRRQIDLLRLLERHEQPVLCSRESFLDALDELLDPDPPSRTVLLVQSRCKGTHAGGSRLLSELAGTALRGGSLPCVVGPFDNDPPRTAALLALFIVQAIVDCRFALGLSTDFPSATLQTVRAAAGRPAAGPGGRPIDSEISALRDTLERDEPVVDASELATGLRIDLVTMLEDAAAAQLLSRPYRASPVLLLDDVDRYSADAQDLCAMLGTRASHAPQAGSATRLKIPVVLFAREHPDGKGTGSQGLAQRLTALGDVLRTDLPMPHELASADGSDHDVLVCLWLLLNPMAGSPLDAWQDGEPAVPRLVLSPRAGQERSWHQTAQTLMAKASRFYDPAVLAELARKGREHDWFQEDDDYGILQGTGLDELELT